MDALLEGTVIRDGDRVRITAQLIDGRTDHHVWSERYDRDLRGILELQSDVARAVARKIELELMPRDVARLANRPRVDPGAHDAFLKGIYHGGRFTPESVRSAVESLERAIELDPGYALAHAWLGHVYAALAIMSPDPREAVARAKSAALRALELDDALAEAHTVLGWVGFVFDWDWSASELHLRRALELNPSLAVAHDYYADHLSTSGRHDEAIAEQRRAVELAPLDLIRRSNGLALAYWYARRYHDAADEVRKVIDIDPTFRPAHEVLGRTYGALGRYDEQIGAHERAGFFAPDVASALRAALSREGPQGYLRELLRVVRNYPGWPRIRLASLHAQLGERDEAFAELERAYASREGGLAFLGVAHGFDPLRDDPRFEELVRRIGIPES